MEPLSGLQRHLDSTLRLHLLDGVRRLKEAATAAAEGGVQLLVDAEYTYQNDAISFLTLLLMKMFNKSVDILVLHTLI